MKKQARSKEDIKKELVLLMMVLSKVKPITKEPASHGMDKRFCNYN